MQRTSSLDIIELTQKGEFNAVSTKKEIKKKKKKGGAQKVGAPVTSHW